MVETLPVLLIRVSSERAEEKNRKENKKLENSVKKLG